MAEMAILQNVDKCIRCNGCVIGCKRTHAMGSMKPGEHRMAPDQRVIIKSRAAGDMGPFVRFSCWHCVNPPCAPKCPKGAVKVDSDTKAVWIDHELCDPTACSKQCTYYCQRGGYPKVGEGSSRYTTAKSYKCTMCTEKIDDLPTKHTAANAPWYGGTAEHANEPTCVYTCPAQAMVYDTLVNVKAHIKAAGYVSAVGAGHVFWVSKKASILPPKADPFIEDHVSPMVSDVLASPLTKALFVPTLVAGGLLAISARRASNEADTAAEEV